MKDQPYIQFLLAFARPFFGGIYGFSFRQWHEWISILLRVMGTNLWWFVGLTKDSVANSGRVKGVVLLLYGNLTAARWFRKHFSKGKGCDFKDMYFFQRELVSHLVGKTKLPQVVHGWSFFVEIYVRSCRISPGRFAVALRWTKSFPDFTEKNCSRNSCLVHFGRFTLKLHPLGEKGMILIPLYGNPFFLGHQ